MIEIKTEKHVTGDGVLGFRILDITVLQLGFLPENYLKDYPFCYRGSNSTWNGLYICLSKTETRNIIKGSFQPAEEFLEKMALIKQCGARLKECNANLAKLRCQWAGKKTFKI